MAGALMALARMDSPVCLPTYLHKLNKTHLGGNGYEGKEKP